MKLNELPAGLEWLDDPEHREEAPRDEIASEYEERLRKEAAHVEDFAEGFEARVAALVHAVENCEAAADALQEKEQKLRSRRDAYRRQAEFLRGTIEMLLVWRADEHGDEQKVKTPEFTVYMQKGRQKVTIDDETMIPNRFFKMERRIERQKIMEYARKTGEVPSGARIERGAPVLVVKK